MLINAVHKPANGHHKQTVLIRTLVASQAALELLKIVEKTAASATQRERLNYNYNYIIILSLNNPNSIGRSVVKRQRLRYFHYEIFVVT